MRKQITKFALRHPDFGIPGIMKYISIANGVFWLISMINGVFLSYLTFSMEHILHGQIWRIISFMFIPPSTSFLGIIAVYFYYVIGTTLEQYWGSARFNLFLFFGYIWTVVFGILMYVVFKVNVSISATYIFLSMFFAFALMFPDAQALYMFLIPIKMKWLAIIDLVFFVINIFTLRFPLNLLPIIALANVALFCWDQIVDMIRSSRR